MARFNSLIDWCFDGLFSWLRPLPASAGLAVASLLTGVCILTVLRLTSDQPAIAATKRQIHADLLEMRLYNDDLAAMLRAQASVIRHNAAYLRLSIVPMLWMTVPLILAGVQFQSWFGYTGLTAGLPVLLTADLRRTDNVNATLLDTPRIKAESAGIWFPSLQQVVWRIVPEAGGDYVVRIKMGEETFEKTLHVSDGVARRSPLRPPRNLVTTLLNPSEVPLADDAPLSRISVLYPDRHFRLLGWEIHWMAIFFIESLVFVFALKGPFRVSF